jgi:hypothetical protein
MEEDKIEKALRHYESMRRASAAYYERKRQGKIEDGTYRGRGRPKKASAIFRPPENTNILE